MKNMFTQILTSNWANLFYILSFAISFITLLILIQYASDTRLIANQAVETNLRPVILRAGYINNWNQISFTHDSKNNFIDGTPLQFSIQKNIATNISGYIILNKNKYSLLFGNNISQINSTQTNYSKIWGWVSPGSTLNSIFDPLNDERVDLPNQIYISYQDIEGNEYYTLEDQNFSSKSFIKN